MRKILPLIFTFVGTAFAMGGQPQVETLTPAKIIDTAEKIHTVTNLVCDDKNYFVFTDGAVSVKIPFVNIKKVVFEKEGQKLLAKVYLKDGSVKVFVADPQTDCVGTTLYGSVEAPLSAIKEIDFLPVKNKNRD